MNQVVHVEATVPAPPARVFALLAEPTGWPAWSGHDRGEAVRAGAADPLGVGAVRAFTLGRYRSVEEIVAYEPSEHFAYALLSGLPVRGYRADVRLVPVDGGAATTIAWHSTFRPAVPGTGGLLRRRLQGFIEGAVAGLARHAAAAGATGAADVA